MQNDSVTDLQTRSSSFRWGLEIIRWSCVFLFLGRGWQHLFWDPPYRSLIWDETLLKGVVESWTSFSWQQWVTDPRIDSITQNLIFSTGLFYLLCAAAAIRVGPGRTVEKALLTLGALSLGFLSLLYGKSKFYQLGQFLEYALQVGAPIFLVWMVRAIESPKSFSANRFALGIKIATVLTFVCHGLYAVGYYPVPGDFVEMTMVLLGVQDRAAVAFLFTAGVLDFLLSVALFSRRFTTYAYAYAAFWGTGTALARVISYSSWPTLGADLHQWLPETLLRLPHGMIPAAAFLMYCGHGFKFQLPRLLRKS